MEGTTTSGLGVHSVVSMEKVGRGSESRLKTTVLDGVLKILFVRTGLPCKGDQISSEQTGRSGGVSVGRR